MNPETIAIAKRSLLASLVIVGMGFSVLFPILGPLGRELGFNEIQITSIIAISSLTVVLSAPMWGRLSDRWGRKKVMVIGLFGFTGGTVLFNTVLHIGLSEILTGMSLYVLLVIVRIAHAAVMAATLPASNAYMADITSLNERTKGMGALGAANNVGAIMGPAVAGLAVVSLLTPLWIVAVLACLNGLFVIRFLPDVPPTSPSAATPKLSYLDSRIWPFILVGVVMFSGYALVQQTMGFRYQDALGLSAQETAQTFGLAMMLSAVASLFAQAIVVQRWSAPPRVLLITSIPLLFLAFVLLYFFETEIMLTVSMVVLGLGMGLSGPGLMAGASLAVTAEEQGAVAGIAGSCGPLGFFLGTLIGGALYQTDPTLPYITAAVVYLILFLYMLRVFQGLGDTATDV